VRGQPLIGGMSWDWRAQGGADRDHLAWLGSQISEYLGDGARYGVAIVTVKSSRARSIRRRHISRLADLGSAPFTVVNGDLYTDFPLETLRLTADCDAHLVLVPNPPWHPRGDFGLEQGLALAGAASRYTFSGIGVYRSAFFKGCLDGVFPLQPLLLRSMAAKCCSAELFIGPWENVGRPSSCRL